MDLSELLALGGSLANAASPHVVIRAADGAELWIPVTIPTGSDSSGATSLWPKGFTVALRIGQPPTAPHVTKSPTYFIGTHALDLLRGWWVSPPANPAEK